MPSQKTTIAAKTCATYLAACLSVAAARADLPATLDVEVDKPGATVAPSFYGLMTEEINHSYDGGLFAELIQNRTFQDPGQGKDGAPIHWSVGGGKVTLDHDQPVNAALPISLRLALSDGMASIANDGFWGIPVRPDTTYTASFYAKGGGGFAAEVGASLVTDEGDIAVATAKTLPVTDAWQKYTVTLKTARDAPTTAKARFVLSATGSGSVSFSLVSLFPPTYQDIPNGLRPDLMKLMADLHPAFIRLPGGNYLEGMDFANRFNWKQMIGPADERPGHMGCWHYRSSDGFGLPEFLLWCKQLGAEPVLAVFAGYTLNHKHVDAGSPEMAQYTEEALKEIEYVSGPSDSEWGKKRMADGFPEPFPLHYIEIGNEDWFDKSGSYDGRFTQIAKAVRQHYPHLKVIATAPVKSFQPDLYDDHLYASARQMLAGFSQYDKRPDTGTMPLKFQGGRWNGRQPDDVKTFVGEWATQEGRPTPDLNAALADAAYLMGLEQNADAVEMQCYAPLLVNVNPADPVKGYSVAWQWPTNLIGYDALHSFGSPSYYAQAMFAQNQGDRVLPSKFEVAPVVAPEPVPHGAIGVGTYNTQAEYKDIVVTAPDGRNLLTADLTKDTSGWQFTGGKWDLQNQALKPSAADSESWGTTGDPDWTDYTIHLRARKVSGKEGFLVLWHAADGENYNWWNIGGSGNTVVHCEATVEGGHVAFGPSGKFTVEAGRWYDLRLEVRGNSVRGFVDDQLVTDATQEPHPVPVAAVASVLYASSNHTMIIKVVNAGKDPLDAAINLRGAARIEPDATALVLAGKPKAVNTVEQPMNVVPKAEAFSNASASFRRTFPPHSLTLLRLKASPQ